MLIVRSKEAAWFRKIKLTLQDCFSWWPICLYCPSARWLVHNSKWFLFWWAASGDAWFWQLFLAWKSFVLLSSLPGVKRKLIFFHAKDKTPWLCAVVLPLRLGELHLLGFVVIKCRGSSWWCLLPSVCASYLKQGLVFHWEPGPYLAAVLQGFSLENARWNLGTRSSCGMKYWVILQLQASSEKA